MSPSQKAYMKQWRDRNRSKVSEYNRNHRQKYLEQVRAKDRARDKLRTRVRPQHKIYIKAYRAKNKGVLLAKSRAFYKANRERLLEWKRQHPPPEEHKRNYNRNWCRNNPAKVQQHRVLRKTGASTSAAELELINAFILKIRSMPSVHCNYCGRVLPGKEVDIDHIIPISRGGKHALFNLCASCPTCNNRKHAKLPSEWKRKGQLFLSL